MFSGFLKSCATTERTESRARTASSSARTRARSSALASSRAFSEDGSAGPGGAASLGLLLSLVIGFTRLDDRGGNLIPPSFGLGYHASTATEMHHTSRALARVG